MFYLSQKEYFSKIRDWSPMNSIKKYIRFSINIISYILRKQAESKNEEKSEYENRSVNISQIFNKLNTTAPLNLM